LPASFYTLDYKETDMKNARLIKRNPLSEQPITEDHQKADSQPVIIVPYERGGDQNA
jgi:hypothetical protein